MLKMDLQSQRAGLALSAMHECAVRVASAQVLCTSKPVSARASKPLLTCLGRYGVPGKHLSRLLRLRTRTWCRSCTSKCPKPAALTLIASTALAMKRGARRLVVDGSHTGARLV